MAHLTMYLCLLWGLTTSGRRTKYEEKMMSQIIGEPQAAASSAPATTPAPAAQSCQYAGFSGMRPPLRQLAGVCINGPGVSFETFKTCVSKAESTYGHDRVITVAKSTLSVADCQDLCTKNLKCDQNGINCEPIDQLHGSCLGYVTKDHDLQEPLTSPSCWLIPQDAKRSSSFPDEIKMDRLVLDSSMGKTTTKKVFIKEQCDCGNRLLYIKRHKYQTLSEVFSSKLKAAEELADHEASKSGNVSDKGPQLIQDLKTVMEHITDSMAEHTEIAALSGVYDYFPFHIPHRLVKGYAQYAPEWFIKWKAPVAKVIKDAGNQWTHWNSPVRITSIYKRLDWKAVLYKCANKYGQDKEDHWYVVKSTKLLDTAKKFIREGNFDDDELPSFEDMESLSKENVRKVLTIFFKLRCFGHKLQNGIIHEKGKSSTPTDIEYNQDYLPNIKVTEGHFGPLYDQGCFKNTKKAEAQEEMLVADDVGQLSEDLDELQEDLNHPGGRTESDREDIQDTMDGYSAPKKKKKSKKSALKMFTSFFKFGSSSSPKKKAIEQEYENAQKISSAEHAVDAIEVDAIDVDVRSLLRSNQQLTPAIGSENSPKQDALEVCKLLAEDGKDLSVLSKFDTYLLNMDKYRRALSAAVSAGRGLAKIGDVAGNSWGAIKAASSKAANLTSQTVNWFSQKFGLGEDDQESAEVGTQLVEEAETNASSSGISSSDLETEYLIERTMDLIRAMKEVFIRLGAIEATNDIQLKQYCAAEMLDVVQTVGGLWPKLSQNLAVRPDLVPSNFARNKLKETQSGNPDKGKDATMQFIREQDPKVEIGGEMFSITEFMEYSGFKAAGSVGQIDVWKLKGRHLATKFKEETIPKDVLGLLEDPSEYIVKTVFEETEQRYMEDWALMKFFFETAPSLRILEVPQKLSSVWTVMKTLETSIFDEFDLSKEAEFTERGRKLLKEFNKDHTTPGRHSATRVTAPFGLKTSSKYVMIQTTAPGSPLSAHMEHIKGQWDRLAEWRIDIYSTILNVFGYTAIQHGFFQADPHPGNWFWEPSKNVLTLIDWGGIEDWTQEKKVKKAHCALANLYSTMGELTPRWEACDSVTLSPSTRSIVKQLRKGEADFSKYYGTYRRHGIAVHVAENDEDALVTIENVRLSYAYTYNHVSRPYTLWYNGNTWHISEVNLKSKEVTINKASLETHDLTQKEKLSMELRKKREMETDWVAHRETEEGYDKIYEVTMTSGYTEECDEFSDRIQAYQMAAERLGFTLKSECKRLMFLDASDKILNSVLHTDDIALVCIYDDASGVSKGSVGMNVKGGGILNFDVKKDENSQWWISIPVPDTVSDDENVTDLALAAQASDFSDRSEVESARDFPLEGEGSALAKKAERLQSHRLERPTFHRDQELSPSGVGKNLAWGKMGFQIKANSLTGLPVSLDYSLNKYYLSTTSKGDKVKLHDTDDGSGRQRWVIIKGSGDYYSIKVVGGVSGNEGYLIHEDDTVTLGSSETDAENGRWLIKKGSEGDDWYNIESMGTGVGTGRFLSVSRPMPSISYDVFLHDQDDGSGRQRWIIPGFAKSDAADDGGITQALVYDQAQRQLALATSAFDSDVEEALVMAVTARQSFNLFQPAEIPTVYTLFARCAAVFHGMVMDALTENFMRLVPVQKLQWLLPPQNDRAFKKWGEYANEFLKQSTCDEADKRPTYLR